MYTKSHKLARKIPIVKKVLNISPAWGDSRARPANRVPMETSRERACCCWESWTCKQTWVSFEREREREREKERKRERETE